jgi:uncharacterized membrane protein YdjX (TVP38/TMEM64 family)
LKKYKTVGKWGLWIVVFILIWILISPAVDLLKVVQDREKIVAEVNRLGIWGPVTLITAYALQMIIAVIPGHLLGVASGYLYGFWGGFLLSWVTVVVTGQALFYLARIYGKPVVYQLVPNNLLDKWDHIAKREGIVFFAFSFILPIFPADVMVYVAGLSHISARDFLIAQLIGRLPFSILMVGAGAYGFKLSSEAVVVIIIASVVLFAAWLKYGQSIEAQIVNQEA